MVELEGSSAGMKTSANAIVMFGVLGLIPFWAPLAAPFLWPQWSGAANLQLVYGGLILSFLGGVRLGRVLSKADALSTIALSMLPSITGLAVAGLPSAAPLLRYGVLIASLAVMWVWDRSSESLPASYRRLRTPLTACAIAALGLGVFLLGQSR